LSYQQFLLYFRLKIKINSLTDSPVSSGAIDVFGPQFGDDSDDVSTAVGCQGSWDDFQGHSDFKIKISAKYRL
jgi:hypothetical protein